jgi:hypothetical protein
VAAASLYSEVDAVKRKVRPRTRSQQNPISADIMGETMSIGGEGKLEVAEHKIRLEWERTVSHQEGEEVPHPLYSFFLFFSFLFFVTIACVTSGVSHRRAA